MLGLCIVAPIYATEPKTAHEMNLAMKDRFSIEEDNKEEWIDVKIKISFYTDLKCENSSLGSVDAQGNKLIYGTLAVPRDMELGTEFTIDGYEGMFIARDRGSSKYIKWLDDTTVKIDMFIPRKNGESNKDYFKRVNSLGIVETTGRYKIGE